MPVAQPPLEIPPDERPWEAGNGYRLEHDFGTKFTATASDKAFLRKAQIRSMIKQRFGPSVQFAVMENVIAKEDLCAKPDDALAAFFETWSPPNFHVDDDDAIACGPAGHGGLESMPIQLAKLDLKPVLGANAHKNEKPNVQPKHGVGLASENGHF